MSYDLSQIVKISNDIGHDTLAMCAVLSCLSFFNLITLFSGLIYFLRRVSIETLKQKMMEEDDKSDLKKLEID
jgi:hypothetical protein